LEDSSISVEGEQIMPLEATENDPSIDLQFENDDKNRRMTNEIGQLSDKLSEIDN
jgi:hypothetical protein